MIETETVKSLKLGKTVKDPAAGSVCLVAGWGRTNYSDNKGSDVLMSVNVTVIDRKKCNQSYKGRPAITDSMICAGSSSKTEADTCQVRCTLNPLPPVVSEPASPVSDCGVFVPPAGRFGRSAVVQGRARWYHVFRK